MYDLQGYPLNKPLFDQGFGRYSNSYREIKCQATGRVYTSTECTVYTITSSFPALNLQLNNEGIHLDVIKLVIIIFYHLQTQYHLIFHT